ncbi:MULTISPECIES: acetolactate synthase small subunit [Corynebacterium]|mgnify:FL=1|uniref:Acetolactate synthase small subunit n=1 Tax=Corynebacterium amycolatum TaxID=43765 RepID=A0AB38XSW0_CORAY|nr:MULTISPECIES: acetolactate synthase small subunit [Corynebacterium]AIN82245.1 acetolactate synthase, small subunit [Corynebacterium sp. ATCC 6931]KAA9289762.1 acetolactate synthase small subunit [Corynebacterium amycolatum]MBC6726704.1 acetolactate synthase small subunit [Corynebacterium amycolatum]MBC6758299.1 acetolactate synthase small subunit [Corynebacterium sp. LK24]MBC6806476.1 acetolactate synthase small subunit [Corynebacterium sp. LK30]
MAELHTLSVLTLDEPGILVRIAGMFTRRGFSIQSITSGETETEGVNRITVVVETETLPIEQITKQLNKLVPVLKVVRQPPETMVSRGLLMVKVSCDNTNRPQVVDAANLFRARVVDVSQESVIIEATGERSKLVALLEVLEPFGIRELIQSGTVAMARGPKPMLQPR